MTDEMIAKAERELELINKMNKEDAAALIGGYHRQLLSVLTDALRKTQDLVNLSPNMIALSETSYVIGEIDRFDKGNVSLLGIVGSSKNIALIINEIFKQSPDVFTEVCKLRGLSEEEKIA